MIKRYGNNINEQYCTFVCDDVNELSQIEGEMANTVFVIHTQDIYMLDSKDTWVCITSNTGSVDCNCIEESTIWSNIPTVQ